MDKKQKTPQDYAMYYGTIMGVYWALKFILIPAGFTIPLLQILFFILTIFVPVLAYIFTSRYKKEIFDGNITFAKALKFNLYMFMFASLFIAVVHYIYFRFIDNGYIINSYFHILKEFERSLETNYSETLINQLKEALDKISSLSPFDLTLQLFSQNLFYGILMSLPIALINASIKNKNKNN